MLWRAYYSQNYASLIYQGLTGGHPVLWHRPTHKCMLLKSCATNDIQKSTKHGELEDDCSTATAGISVRPCKYVLHSKKTFTKHQSPGRLVRVSSQSYSLAWPDPMGCRLSQNAYFSRRVAKSTCLPDDKEPDAHAMRTVADKLPCRVTACYISPLTASLSRCPRTSWSVLAYQVVLHQ